MAARTVAARLAVHGSSVKVLHSAVEFRRALEELVDAASERVVLTSLYVGAEQEWIMRKLQEKVKSGVRVWTMTDYCRTVRPDKNVDGRACSSAESMVAAAEDGVGGWDAYLYQTPCPYRWQRWFPYRMQETLGVLHWKFYIGDDTVLITGANIATSYLTNRHDRWILFKNEKRLCDTLEQIGRLWHPCCHQVVFPVRGAQYSSDLVRIVPPDRRQGREVLLAKPSRHLSECLQMIEQYLGTITEFDEDCEEDAADLDTMVRLTLGIHCGYAPPGCTLSATEPEFILKALRGPSNVKREDATVVMATPYCNLSPETIDLLRRELGTSRVLEVVGPSPSASSFFNGGPVLSAIPFAYLFLTMHALLELKKYVCVKYCEFVSQAKSTFHAKGIWHIDAAKENGCSRKTRCITLLGSTNFGLRSQKRDLECVFLMDTRAPALVKEVEDEVHNIHQLSERRADDLRELQTCWDSARPVTKLIAKFFATNSFFKSLL